MALLSIVIVKLITNYLGVEGYGKYAAIYEFLAFFGIATDLGLFTIAVREMAKEESNEKREYILANIISLRMILCVVVMAVAIAIAYAIPQYRGIHFGIIIASIAVFLSIIQSALSSLLQFNLKMQWAALAQVLGKAAALGYMVYTVFYGFTNNVGEGFYHLIWAGVVGNGVLVLVTYFAACKYGRIRLGGDFKYMRRMFFKSLPYGLALVLNMIYFRIGSIMFMNSVLPVLTRHVKEATGRVSEILRYSFDFLFISAVPMVIGTYILAYPIIFAISSEQFLSRVSEGFYGSDIALKILMIAMGVAFVNSLFVYSLIATSHQNKLLWINGSCAVLNVCMNLFMVPHFGARGAAITAVVTEILLLILAFSVARKYLRFSFDFGTIWKVLFAGVVMGVAVFSLKDWSYGIMENKNILVLVPVGAVVYGGILWATGGISKEFLKMVRG